MKCYDGDHLLNCIKPVKGLCVQELGVPRLSGSVRQIRVKIQIHFMTGVSMRAHTQKKKTKLNKTKSEAECGDADRVAEILRVGLSEAADALRVCEALDGPQLSSRATNNPG